MTPQLRASTISGRVLCRLGRHTGQREGGTMMFTCPRCGESFWQRHDFSGVTAFADRLIDEGRPDDALRYAEDEIRRKYDDAP